VTHLLKKKKKLLLNLRRKTQKVKYETPLIQKRKSWLNCVRKGE
jgi:hypothetical protein